MFFTIIMYLFLLSLSSFLFTNFQLFFTFSFLLLQVLIFAQGNGFPTKKIEINILNLKMRLWLSMFSLKNFLSVLHKTLNFNTFSLLLTATFNQLLKCFVKPLKYCISYLVSALQCGGVLLRDLDLDLAHSRL